MARLFWVAFAVEGCLAAREVAKGGLAPASSAGVHGPQADGNAAMVQLRGAETRRRGGWVLTAIAIHIACALAVVTAVSKPGHIPR